MNMKVNKKNLPILEFPESHPAHRLLKVLVDSWEKCAGCEIAWPEDPESAVDQTWYSQISQRARTFSGIVYEFLCFDLILVEWIERPPFVTREEKALLNQLDLMEALIGECRAAAEADGNFRVLPLIDTVSHVIVVWRTSIQARIASIPKTTD